MKPEAERRPIIVEDEVVNPDTLRAADAGVDVRTWREAMLLAPMLHENPMDRAVEFLRITGGLGRFLSSTPADLEVLGMEEVEVARIHALPALAAKLLNHHYQTGDLSTRKQLADEIRLRAIQTGWDTAKVLVMGWTEGSRRVLDRIIFEGHPRTTSIDVQHAVRLALTANAAAFALVVWSPEPISLTGCNFQRAADDLRMAGAFFKLTATDFLVLTRDGSISLAVEDQWIE